MSDKYATAKDLAFKIQWEGGATNFVFGYGIGSQDYPEDIPEHVLGAFLMLGVAQQFADTIDEWVDGFDMDGKDSVDVGGELDD